MKRPWFTDFLAATGVLMLAAAISLVVGVIISHDLKTRILGSVMALYFSASGIRRIRVSSRTRSTKS